MLNNMLFKVIRHSYSPLYSFIIHFGRELSEYVAFLFLYSPLRPLDSFIIHSGGS